MSGPNVVLINEWASAWAPTLWRATWQGGIFILAVWLICRVFRAMPATAKAWLWWIASLQLLIRLCVVTTLDLPILPSHESAPVTDRVELRQSAREIPVVISSSRQQYGHEAPLYTEQPAQVIQASLPVSEPVKLSKQATGMLLWPMGILVCIAIALRRMVGARRLVKNATPILEGYALETVHEFSADYGIAVPRLLASKDAPCPLLAGWFRPAIVLPASALEEFEPAQIRMAIAHEFAHIRRKDLWYGALQAITQSLFFFHPLVWLASHEGTAAREAACDTDALRMSGGSPAAYARLLIDSAQAGSSMAVLGSAFGYRLIHRRISMLKTIAGANARRYRTACTAILALGAVCALPWSVTAQSVKPPKTKATNQVRHVLKSKHVHKNSVKHVLHVVPPRSATAAVSATPARPGAFAVPAAPSHRPVPSAAASPASPALSPVTTGQILNPGPVFTGQDIVGRVLSATPPPPTPARVKPGFSSTRSNPFGGLPPAPAAPTAPSAGVFAPVPAAPSVAVAGGDQVPPAPVAGGGAPVAGVPAAGGGFGGGVVAPSAGQLGGIGGGSASGAVRPRSGFGGGFGGQGGAIGSGGGGFAGQGGGLGGGGGIGGQGGLGGGGFGGLGGGGGFGGFGRVGGFGQGMPQAKPKLLGAGKCEVTQLDSDKVTIRCDHVDIHTAIQELFETTNTDYMIKSDVLPDKVTCTLHKVSREEALRTILSAVKQSLTYRVDGGVYQIIPRHE